MAVAPKGTFLCLILVLFKEKYLTILSWRNQMRTCKDYRHRCACVARDPSAPVEMPPDGPSTRLLAYPLVSCVSLSDWSCVFEAKVVWSSAACYSVFCLKFILFFFVFSSNYSTTRTKQNQNSFFLSQEEAAAVMASSVVSSCSSWSSSK